MARKKAEAPKARSGGQKTADTTRAKPAARVGSEQPERALIAAEDARDYAEAIIDTIREPLVILNSELCVVGLNPAFCKVFGYPQTPIGSSLFELGGGEWNDPELRQLLVDILLKSKEFSNFEFRQGVGKAREKRLLLNARQILRKGVGSPFILLAIEDITEFVRYQDELRALTARLISVQESNNRMLARELHDDFTQKLAASSMELTGLSANSAVSVAELQNEIRRIAKDLGKTAAEIHQFSRQLHPSILDDLGLAAALKAECELFAARHQTPCDLIEVNVPNLISETTALCIYRVTQEALRNVGKHAGSERVEIRLRGVDGAIELSVADFGGGFDLNKVKTSKGLGLVSMEERARMVGGSFSIASEPGKGTTVVVRVPLYQAKRTLRRDL